MFGGSLLDHSTLSLDGSLVNFGTLPIYDSLTRHGTPGILGSLCPYDTFLDFGSLAAHGTLNIVGSLRLVGTLPRRGSLFLLGTLIQFDSLYNFGTLSLHGSLLSHGTLGEHGSHGSLGTLVFSGSLMNCGTLTPVGSLIGFGTLQLCGSLISFSTLYPFDLSRLLRPRFLFSIVCSIEPREHLREWYADFMRVSEMHDSEGLRRRFLIFVPIHDGVQMGQKHLGRIIARLPVDVAIRQLAGFQYLFPICRFGKKGFGALGIVSSVIALDQEFFARLVDVAVEAVRMRVESLGAFTKMKRQLLQFGIVRPLFSLFPLARWVKTGEAPKMPCCWCLFDIEMRNHARGDDWTDAMLRKAPAANQ